MGHHQFSWASGAKKNGRAHGGFRILCTPSLPLPGKTSMVHARCWLWRVPSSFPVLNREESSSRKTSLLNVAPLPSLHSRLQSPSLLTGAGWRRTPPLEFSSFLGTTLLFHDFFDVEPLFLFKSFIEFVTILLLLFVLGFFLAVRHVGS